MKPDSNSPSENNAIFYFLLFALLAFLITWGTGMLIVVSSQSHLVNGARPVPRPISLPFPIALTLVMIGGFGPALAAIVVTAVESGRQGVRDLWRQFRRWRVHPIWFATAFLGPPLFGLIALVLTALCGGVTPAHWFALPRAELFLGWAVGPWGEEIGWRGYAQRRLQQRLGAFCTSLLVGALWSFWHYWPVATPAGGPWSEFVSAGFFTWFLYELANSVMMAWLYNSTGSLPIAWASHVGLSLGQNLVDKHPIPFGSFVVVFCLGAALVVLLYGPRRLSRIRTETSSPALR